MEETIMATINLKDFYYWYTQDELIEVSEEVAAKLTEGKRYEQAIKRTMYRYKAHYSLDAADGIEASAVMRYNDSPERLFGLMERRCDLCCALNSLPEIQYRRIEKHFILGMSQNEIAISEGVCASSVNESIKRGLCSMKKYFKKIESDPEFLPGFCQGI